MSGVVERDAARVRDARLHTALTGAAVEWRLMTPDRSRPTGWSAGNHWPVIATWQPCTGHNGWLPVPFYQRDGNGMLAVIEAMRAKGWRVELHTAPKQDAAARFWKAPKLFMKVCDAPTAPEAVCRAALAALEAS